jgi:hypothetical protein
MLRNASEGGRSDRGFQSGGKHDTEFLFKSMRRAYLSA